MSVINAIPMLLGGEGYEISRSVRLRSSASAYFNRTPASAGNQQKWTWSGWAKRGSFGQQQLFGAGAGTGGSPECYIDFEDNLNFQIFDGISNLAIVRSTAVYRDPSAWYHVVVAVDTTQATAANRVLLYINGQQITSFAFSTYPTQNLNTQVNATTAHRISSSTRTSAYYYDGYLTEVNFIDGQALTPSSFGENDTITGVWKPKKYAGTYGTNGFYLNFSDPSAATAAAIGKDYSGNGNNWTPNNISVTSGVTYDSMIDTPTMYADGGNGRGNYAVMNPLFTTVTATIPLSDGNLTGAASSNSYFAASSTIGVNSGKWYVELTLNGNNATNNYPLFGIDTLPNLAGGNAAGGTASGVSYAQNGQKYQSGAFSAYGSAWSVGNVIGLAVDLDSGTRTATFYLNNTSQGSITLAATTETMLFNFGVYGTGESCSINFGQRPFAYTPPTGFKALNTQNLPDSTIKAGNKFFDATLWTGNGTSQSIVNSGAMQPDLVWAKQRSSTQWHRLIDAVRGTDKVLYSNDTSAEFTDNTQLTSFNSNGFSVGSQAGFNANAATYVGWQWKESAAAGFDIVTWTGNGSAQTINHSLGVAPAMIIMKNRTQGAAGYNWAVYHKSISSASAFVDLNTTAGAATNTGIWNATAPTSTVFSVGTARINNGDLNVAYLFAEVAGFSKFGSYTGNGSTDGPMVFTGFKPKFVLIKNASGAYTWITFDSARGTYNVNGQQLYPNTSDAEATDNVNNCMDFLSNGFKFRGASAVGNGSGNTIIYAAFASNPFKYSLAS